MHLSRRLGILVFSAMPAIVGGGIAYKLFGDSYHALFVYEILLLMTAIGLASK